MTLLFMTPIFFLIALLYSTVGLGGGSAYITVMVLAGVSKGIFPVIALLCNLLVASQGALTFRRAGHFRLSVFWPFAVTSIPLAYIGGSINVPDKAFTLMLAVALAVAGIRLLFWNGDKNLHPAHLGLFFKLILGALLGLLAGITGIGGGIYLIPVLIMFGLATPREASATASLFIVVNSVSGLAGQISKGGHIEWRLFLPLAAAVLAGGFIGSRIGATRLKAETLQKIVGIIIFIAVAKLAAKAFNL